MEVGEADARGGELVHVRSLRFDVLPAAHREFWHLRLGNTVGVGAHIPPAVVVLLTHSNDIRRQRSGFATPRGGGGGETKGEG
eukprot:COSAG01_NODE_677_length_14312_cov_10.195314_1_plen_82_part_10